MTTELYHSIYQLNAGTLVSADIKRMFNTHGPYLISGKRLDQLKDVVVLADSSVSTFEEKGSGISKTATGSLVGRSLVGGLVAGPAGAIILGGSANRNESFSSSTTERKSVEYTVKLVFADESTSVVVVKSIESLHFLLGFTSTEPATAEQIANEEKLAREASQEAAVWEEVYKQIPTPKKANADQAMLHFWAIAASIGTFLVSNQFVHIFFAVILAGIAWIVVLGGLAHAADVKEGNKYLDLTKATRIAQEDLFKKLISKPRG